VIEFSQSCPFGISLLDSKSRWIIKGIIEILKTSEAITLYLRDCTKGVECPSSELCLEAVPTGDSYLVGKGC